MPDFTIFRTVLFGMPQKSSSFSGPTTKGVRGGGGKVLATKKKHFFMAALDKMRPITLGRGGGANKAFTSPFLL